MSGPFDFVNSINKGKRNPELLEKDYVPFLINRTFSYFPDTILIANEVNRLHHVDNRLQYDFLINMIRPRNRFTKWTKPTGVDDLRAVAQYYGFSMDKAQQALDILTDDQLNTIKQKTNSGSDSNGKHKQHGRGVS